MMENKPPPMFSVIVACYNYGRFLQRAVDSVLAQDCIDYEIIVVDDGSTDETPQVAAQFGEKIVYHRQENAGHCATNNKGASLARGEYFYFLDADDELLPNALSIFAKNIGLDHETPVWFGGYISVSADGEEMLRPGSDIPVEAYARMQAYVTKGVVGLKHGSVVMHRKIFAEMQYPINLRSSTDIVFLGQVISRFSARGIHTPVLKSHAHGARVRKNTSLRIATGLSSVDIMFDPAVVPAPLQPLKRLFRRNRLKSLARSCYRSHQYPEARELYLTLVREFPAALMDVAVIRRLVVSLLRASSSKNES